MANDYDFYAAGPFFNPSQVASMERMERVLESHGKHLFKPRFVSDVTKVGPTVCFENDLHGILSSSAVIANLVDEDSGTMYEIGFAHAHHMPVYGYLEGVRAGSKVNLMISQSLDALFASPDDLDAFLATGIHHDVAINEF